MKNVKNKILFLVTALILLFNSNAAHVAENNRESDTILSDIYDQKDELGSCEYFLDWEYSQEASQVISINEQEYLVIFYCFLAAYQANFEFVKYVKNSSEKNIEVLTVDGFKEYQLDKLQKSKVNSFAGLPYYDEETKVITIKTRFGCGGATGSLTKYQWENSQLKLLEYKAKFDCQEPFLEPEDYPTLYP